MNVDAPQTLAQWLEQPAEGLRLLCHPDADDDLAGALAALRNQDGTPALTLLVGPEGGWSDKELDQARAAGAVSQVRPPGAAHGNGWPGTDRRRGSPARLVTPALPGGQGNIGADIGARQPGATYLQSYSLSP